LIIFADLKIKYIF